MAKHSQRNGNYGKAAHANINVDNNTDCDAFEEVYISGEFKNPDIRIHAVSL